MQTDNRLVWVLAFLLLALLLSALANLYFIRLGRHFFREFSLTRLDPLGIAQIDTAEDAHLAAAPEKRVVFVGDSRAAAWPAPGALPGFVFINRGVNGHTAVQTQQRFDRHVTPLQPHIVVIQVGINDLHSIAVLADEKAAVGGELGMKREPEQAHFAACFHPVRQVEHHRVIRVTGAKEAQAAGLFHDDGLGLAGDKNQGHRLGESLRELYELYRGGGRRPHQAPAQHHDQAGQWQSAHGLNVQPSRAGFPAGRPSRPGC